MEEKQLATKEQFIEAYNKYPPKKWIRFAFKYFSQSTEVENMKLSKSFSWIILILFVVGFVGTILELPKIVIGIATISFSVILATLVLFLFTAVKANNKRIKKIANELGVTILEYNKLAGWWGDELK